MNQEQNPHEGNSTHESPFEWLTNFRSIRHLVFPSRIVFGNKNKHGDALEHVITEGRGFDRHHQNLTSNQPKRIYLNALHVGCGTSTLGESLACVREHYYHENSTTTCNRINKYILQYGHIINVDNDQKALDSMRNRWECKLTSKHHQMDDDGKNDSMSKGVHENSKSMLAYNSMEWKQLNFASDESYRMALDDVYHPLMQRKFNALNVRGGEYIHEEKKAENIDDQQPPGGCIDLVIDKSTLDCLLCSETIVIAQFLCEIYRALRVPSAGESNTGNNDDVLSWGGVYVLITFHPVEFIDQLLKNLPGADWDVEHQVIQRQVEDVTCLDGDLQLDEVDNLIRTTEKDGSLGCGCDELQLLPSDTSCTWSSGNFHSDDNYRRTVNAFTCRRRPPPTTTSSSSSSSTSNGGNTSSSPSSLLTYILNREKVREHIEQTCNNWYRNTNPIVTSAREEQLRAAFLKLTDASSGKEAILDLKQCYDIIFTDLEREHLDYEHFLEDWDAYWSSRHGVDNEKSVNPGGMTVAIALDFLKEMQ